jgi:hypothetical protein
MNGKTIIVITAPMPATHHQIPVTAPNPMRKLPDRYASRPPRQAVDLDAAGDQGDSVHTSPHRST